jgi:sugar phosphate isomerase/epimerase
MKTIKGPGIFLAQFAGDDAPYNTLAGMAKWAAGLGFVGVQIPTWDKRLFDLKRAAESQDYCDEILATVRRAGMEVTELSTHLQGQLVAANPAFDLLLDGRSWQAMLRLNRCGRCSNCIGLRRRAATWG